MIWDACDGVNHITTISGTLLRLVESQEQVATMGYVDTLDEQALLEEMLELAKPPYSEAIQNYHYLLTTPFRYPPLNWGSRFGRTHEPSLFYAGRHSSATLAESAFYRFVFLDSMEGIVEEDKIRSEHTMFSVGYKTDKGVQLQSMPFDQYSAELMSRQHYHHTQQLGSEMRVAGVEAIEYKSARDPNHQVCVALYNTLPFRQNSPTNMTQWLCETSQREVLFKQLDKNNIVHFPKAIFLLNGTFSFPA